MEDEVRMKTPYTLTNVLVLKSLAKRLKENIFDVTRNDQN
jgi:hypothetical protein